MHISFFSPEKTEAVVDVFCELARHYFGDDASPRAAVHQNFVTNILGPDSGVRVVVACEGSAVAGIATISLLYPAPKERGQLFMKDLYVGEAWRGKGVGEQIMEFLAQYAVSKNCIRFDWTTESTNQSALAFYQRLGAKPVAEKVYFRLSGDELASFAAGRNS